MPRMKVLQATAWSTNGMLERLAEGAVVEVDEATADRWERLGLAQSSRARLQNEADEEESGTPTPPQAPAPQVTQQRAPQTTGQSARQTLSGR